MNIESTELVKITPAIAEQFLSSVKPVSMLESEELQKLLPAMPVNTTIVLLDGGLVGGETMLRIMVKEQRTYWLTIINLASRDVV